MDDVTPDGDPIDVRVQWVLMPDGSERPFTVDLTRLNATLRKARAALDRFRESLPDEEAPAGDDPT